jgi:hypothetical protein
MESDNFVVFSSIRCLNCSETLVSRHRHDYKVCKCSNKTMIDGGLKYTRMSAVNMDETEVTTIYSDAPIEVLREHVERGGRGINGDEPLTWVKIKDVNDAWLHALLTYVPEGWYLVLVKKEIQYRLDICKKQ